MLHSAKQVHIENQMKKEQIQRVQFQIKKIYERLFVGGQ